MSTSTSTTNDGATSAPVTFGGRLRLIGPGIVLALASSVPPT